MPSHRRDLVGGRVVFGPINAESLAKAMKVRSYASFACCVAKFITQARGLEGLTRISKNKGGSDIWDAIDSGSEFSRKRHTRNDPAFLAFID